ncbi:U3 small nucleolar ribonucleoprotein protein Mpp10 [Paecilomyces variotii No. 5]|uniref:U3 small nucleolar ribonucleoprotein protein MPP10 n=1 Tax=Byssochlamys spectabilis (strain No. 5 / NBRC 109023) TaxID=1356009 RepID=V5FTT7_BYSSN|nr:U3 small nucleolar ribonucleoprotein protein Mpp10 [Paecilomyces variotii No. 5]
MSVAVMNSATKSTKPGGDSLPKIVESLSSAPHNFLRPTSDLYASSVASARYYLDSLAEAVSSVQTARQQENRKKRKRSELGESYTEDVLRLKQLHVDGFSVGQIWEQAARILNSTNKEIKRDLSVAPVPSSGSTRISRSAARESPSDDDLDSDQNDEDDGSMLSGQSQDELDYSDASEIEGDLEESDMGSDAEELDEEDNAGSSDEDDENRDVYVEDPHGLNDGFFSIDDFNKQSELLERQDMRGAPDDDDDEEEDIDWHADPRTLGQTSSAKGRSSAQDDDDQEDESDEEDGPTFGNANLNEMSDSENDEADYENAGGNTSWIDTSNIKYNDFFAPPPRKVSKKHMRALPKTQPEPHDIENELERAMADVRRDLFEDESEDEGSETGSDVESQDGHSGNARSSHEKQRAKIASEIRRLEAENVAKKEWMLAGEARAMERPVNSLIEEDLEFERIGKPVPVVTQETTEDIEELVKRRIIAKEFDEVIRRRPDAISGQHTRRGRVELDDSKPQQSLAELYEADHLRATDSAYMSQKDKKLKREHDEITELWKDISSQLDSLSNWHYKPKTPQASINVVTDVATVTMEDARPTAGAAVSGPGALAPQEIYAPEGGKTAGEVVLKGGSSLAKDEMSREEKLRHRRRQKEKQKKANANAPPNKTGKTAEKQQVISDLKKGDVKVLGQNGEMRDVQGRLAGSATGKKGDVLKL